MVYTKSAMPLKVDLLVENEKLRARLTLMESMLGNRAVLTTDQVREARKLYRDGRTQMELATRYGVTQAAISYMLSGKTYKNVA